MRGGTANLERRGVEDPGALAQIIFGIEIDSHGHTGGSTAGNEQSLGDLYIAFDFRLAILRGKIGGEIEKAAEARRRVHEASGGEIERADLKLGSDGSERSVFLVDGTSRSIELKFSARRKIGRQSYGKRGSHRKVGRGDVHVIVGAALRRLVEPTTMLPSARVNFCTERSAGEVAVLEADAAGFCADFAALAPREE